MQISLDLFQKKFKLGQGSSSKVYLYENKVNKQLFAVKVYLKKPDINSLVIKYKHPMGTQLLFQSERLGKYYFFFEFIQGGDLENFLSLQKKISYSQTQFYIASLWSFIIDIHRDNIVYRDLKPANILITSKGYLKLCDFDFAKQLQYEPLIKPQKELYSQDTLNFFIGKQCLPKTHTLLGTPQYISPEVIRKDAYSFAVDYWSLGIILYELIAGFLPFKLQECQDVMSIYENILKGQLYFPRNMDPRAKSMIKILLINDAEKRFEFGNQLRKHAFFKDFDFEGLIQERLVPEFIPSLDSQDDLDYFPEYSQSSDSNY